MPLLILDNIIVFLWRLFGHRFRASRCQKWPCVSGKIENVDCPEHEMYPYAEIHYCYQVDGAEFDSRCLRGFWHDDSARGLARRYERLKSAKIRYSPENSATSYILDDDQDFAEFKRTC